MISKRAKAQSIKNSIEVGLKVSEQPNVKCSRNNPYGPYGSSRDQVMGSTAI